MDHPKPLDLPDTAIRPCIDRDFDRILAIVNDAAQAYRGVIPADCWHEPYMSADALAAARELGICFWGCELDGALVGVMGIQPLDGVTLIRHAYVLTRLRRGGIGGRLLQFLMDQATQPVLIGTWRAAVWAIRFYEKHSFSLVTDAEKDRLLPMYWEVPPRQIETSVVLGDPRWFDEQLAGWVNRYFDPGRSHQALAALAQYGTQSWHREPHRVKRDAIILSRGSLPALAEAVQLAMRDYREILVGEAVDPWLIGELRRHGELSP